jgi:acetyltransferase-like isoleucine patch superfamily enzyme
VVVNSDCRIGRFCILNTKALLDHDGLMEDYSSLAPNAAAGGNVTVGTFSAISLGANIVHGVFIGEHTILGAGALALENIPDHCVAYGAPAKYVRKRGEGERYL